MMPLTLLIPTLEDVKDIVTCLAPFLKPGQVLFLKGALGSGKTTFARALIQHISPPNTDVPSPTFTLIQTYPLAKPPVIHMDLYRLVDSSELEELGFQEDQAHSLTLIEWPDIIPPQILAPTYILEFLNEEHRYYLTYTGDKNALLEKALSRWVITQ